MVRRTKDKAQETRNRILDAAEQVFSDRGVSRTSLNDIAEAAGVTRGAIYWHFQDKSELFCAMLGRVTMPMEELRDRAAGQLAEDPLAYIRAMALNILTRTATDAQCQRVFDVVVHKCEYLDEMAEVKQRFARMREGCLQKIEQGFRQAIKRGTIARVDPRLASVGLTALIDGVIMNWLVDRRFFPLERRAAALVDLYLDGLRYRGAKHAPRTAHKAIARRRARAA